MIFEAIAAIKIANEAIGAVKELCGHIQSVGQMGPQLTKLADSKEAIQKKAEEGDMDAFFALEDIRRQEAEIKQMFIYQGRAGLWDDYQKFMRTRKEMRENERRRLAAKKAAQKKMIKDVIIYGSLTIGALMLIGGAIWGVMWMVSLKG